jgi:hypothetical protein
MGDQNDESSALSHSSDTLERGSRIAGQYFQATVQYWVNINTMNWQRLLAIPIIQSGGLGVGFEQRPSWMSVFAILVAFVLSIALLRRVISDRNVRINLTRQANYISMHLLAPLADGHPIPPEFEMPFQLYDFETGKRDRVLRGPVALMCFVAAFDIACAGLFNFGDAILPHVEILQPMLRLLPLFKQ